jgi:hypothetical protein
MQGWISEMCQHVKSVAPKQLVGIGYEGFYGAGSGKENLNPADWASREGQNFVANAQDPCIDYVRRAELLACGCCVADACAVVLLPHRWACTCGPVRAADAAACLSAAALTFPLSVDNWGMKTPAFQKAFIENHLRDVATAIKGKPVILEECVCCMAAAGRRVVL